MNPKLKSHLQIDANRGRTNFGCGRVLVCWLALFLFVFPAAAATFSLGNISTVAGGMAVIPLTVSGAPTNLSAFCLFLTNATGFAPPSVSAGASQSNLVVFVDNFGNGAYRVTGFVTNNPPVGNGVIANLAYTVPASAVPGTYPLALTAVPPANAPTGPNPEARSLVNDVILASIGSPGYISIGAVTPPFLTSLTLVSNNVFQFAFTNAAGASFTVFTSTNVGASFTNWTVAGTATQISPGQYQFTDAAATNFPHRFYEVRSP